MALCVTGFSMCFESETIVCYCLHVARIHGTWNQKKGVAPLTVTPNNPLINFNRFSSWQLYTCRSGDLSPCGKNSFTREQNNGSSQWTMRLDILGSLAIKSTWNNKEPISWSDWSWITRGYWIACIQWKQRILCLELLTTFMSSG